jgi:hypothetical protein
VINQVAPKVKQNRSSPDLTGSTKEVLTDAQGMDRAYQHGDAYVDNNVLHVAGSHTARDWFDDVTKIPQWQYIPRGVIDAVDMMNSFWGKQAFGTGDLRQSERYQKALVFLKNHPEVDMLEGHSLGGSVVLQLQKDFPERNLKTVTYGAPVMDPFGLDKAKIGQANVLRFSNKGDPVSVFDNSALKTTHPDPQHYLPAFWHDFHNKEQTSGRIAGVNTQGGLKLGDRWVQVDIAPKLGSTTKADWTTEPWAHINPDSSISITE